MNRNSVWLLIAFLASALAVGRSYWAVPYSGVSLPGSLMVPGLLIVVISACLLAAYGVARFRTVFLIHAASVPAVVFLRIVMDGLADPTLHNLWPLEILIASGVGLSVALPGTVAGILFAFINRRRTKL